MFAEPERPFRFYAEPQGGLMADRTGVLASAVWLGTANFGMPGCDDAAADRIVGGFLAGGHRVIETGGGGPQELNLVGRALRGRRGPVLLTAKVLPPVDPTDVTAILRSLGTDHL